MEHLKTLVLIFLIVIIPSRNLTAVSLRHTPPTIVNIEVVHPLGSTITVPIPPVGNYKIKDTGYVKITFTWDTEPNIEEGTMFEIGLMLDDKNFAVPFGGNDKSPLVGYSFKKNGQPVECGYRDVLNYSNAETTLEADYLVYEFCEEFINSVTSAALTDIADKYANYSVGTTCPEIDLEKGAYYEIIYYLQPSVKNTQGIYSSFIGNGNISVGVIEDTCGSIYSPDKYVKCPFLNGYKIFKFLGIKFPSIYSCYAKDTVWVNRICVPTEKISIPINTYNASDHGTSCHDTDEDGFVSITADNDGNPVEMFTSNRGDCDDCNVLVDNSYYNPDKSECWAFNVFNTGCSECLSSIECLDNEYCAIFDSYSWAHGACLNCGYPQLLKPYNYQEFAFGETIKLTFLPVKPEKTHFIKFRYFPPDQDEPETTYGPKSLTNTEFSSSGIDFFKKPGLYRWVVYDKDNCCKGDGNCYSVPKYFKILEPKTCIGVTSEACGLCGVRTRTCNDGVWSSWSICKNATSCNPTQTKKITLVNVKADDSIQNKWPTNPATNCTPNTTATCGNCGKKTCLADGKWGACQNEGVCSAGSIKTCAVGSVTCTAQCQWPICPTTDCSPNTTDDCGNCGEMTCQANGTWGSCQNQGVCSPGTTKDCTVGNVTCTADCQWPTCPTTTCTPYEIVDCGNCGKKTCSSLGNWSDCNNEGVCAEGTTEEQTCNTTGTQTKTCGDNCYWSDWSACSSSGCACESGICCDGCNYKPTTNSCGSWTEYQCDGQDLEKRTATQYCAGDSTSCDGDTKYTAWTFSKTCTSSQICKDISGVAQCAACTDVYVLSPVDPLDPNGGCYTDPGGLTLCLEIQTTTDNSIWKFRITKEGNSFQNTFLYGLIDQNNWNKNLGEYTGYANTSTTTWHDFNVSYIEGYGIEDYAAGLNGYVISPATCTYSECQFHTGYKTIWKDCQ